MDVMEEKGEVKSYDHQICNGLEISKLFSTFYIIMLVAPMQSGKTGIIYETLKRILKNNINRYHRQYEVGPDEPNGEDDPDELDFIHPDNMFIFTGLSSCDWKKQTQSRFPEFLKENIMHRVDFAKIASTKLITIRDAVFVFDEVHIASRPDQTLRKSLRTMGLNNAEDFKNRNIKVLQVSATPNGCLNDLTDDRCPLSTISHVKFYEPPSGYVWADQLDLRQGKQLCDANSSVMTRKVQRAIHEVADALDTFEEPRYCVIRTASEALATRTENHFKELRGEFTYEYKSINQTNPDHDFLKSMPAKHTIVWLQEFFRCSSTLDKTYIRVMCERPSHIKNEATQSQSLAGRAHGFHDAIDMIIFCDINTIRNYKLAFDEKFKIWTSPSTRTNPSTGNSESTGTFNDMGSSRRQPTATSHVTRIIFKYNPAIIYPSAPRALNNQECFYENTVGEYIKELKERNTSSLGRKPGPRGLRTVANVNGFYLQAFRNRKEVLSVDTIKDERNYGIGANGWCRRFVCYGDTNDITTLSIVLIHKTFMTQPDPIDHSGERI